MRKWLQLWKSKDEDNSISLPLSKKLVFVPNDKVRGQSWITFDLLTKVFCLDEETINHLYSIFVFYCDCPLDLNASFKGLKKKALVPELLSFHKLCSSFALEQSDMLKKVLYFQNQEKAVTFESFAFLTFNICTLRDFQLIYFLFNAYDVENKKFLTSKELHQLLLDLNLQQDAFKLVKRRSNAYLNYDYLYDKDIITFYRFSDLVNKYPVILEQLRNTQIRLQKKVKGKKWWFTTGSNIRKKVIHKLILCLKEDIKSKSDKPQQISKEILSSITKSKLSLAASRRCRNNALRSLEETVSYPVVNTSLLATETDSQLEAVFERHSLQKEVHSRINSNRPIERHLKLLRNIASYRRTLLHEYHNSLLSNFRKCEELVKNSTQSFGDILKQLDPLQSQQFWNIFPANELEIWFDEKLRLASTLQNIHHPKNTKPTGNYEPTTKSYRNFLLHRKQPLSQYIFIRNDVQEKFVDLVRKYVRHCSKPAYFTGLRQLVFEAERNFTLTDELF